MNETKIYQASEFTDAYVIDTIKEVSKSLEEKGYDSVNQIVGYLMSDDPGYISNHKDARKKLTKIDRTRILEVIIRKITN
ncbi:MAG: IreB family regulatory phosphoprotein [Tenericutes bacterium]|nr:IreB family regulatory phosphoprotein [Mycoplasmatota bacterium]MDY3801664.1 IreB family regulatory phosphoprotein [Bacilli bacterium]